jgi:hypothetical protein
MYYGAFCEIVWDYHRHGRGESGMMLPMWLCRFHSINIVVFTNVELPEFW